MSAFRIRPDRPVASELARVIQAQLKAARTRLKGWRADPTGAFHEARRRLKKVRATARVARAVDGRHARRLNSLAREAAKMLSGARDSDVVRATARKLAKACRDPVAAAALAKFAAQPAEKIPVPDGRDAVAQRAGEIITEALDVARKLGEAGAPRDLLTRAAERAIRRADRAFQETRPDGRAEPTEEVRHEWRKRVKELWYIERLLMNVWPLERSVDDAMTNTLGKKLGEERDFLLLASRLRRSARACGGASARDAALAYVEGRRARLVSQADRIGQRLHEEHQGAAERPVRSAA
jgi:hypothetical protein